MVCCATRRWFRPAADCRVICGLCHAKPCGPARPLPARLSAMRAGESAELLHHRFVDGALEGHHQSRKLADVGPAPGVELGCVAWPLQHNLLLRAMEAGREPLLLLPAPAATPGLGPQLLGQVVGVPAAALGEDFDRAHAGLLLELT